MKMPIKPFVLPLILTATFCSFFSELSVAQQLEIEVRGGNQAMQPIAVVPFSGSTSLDMSGIIAADLTRTGMFRSLPATSFPSKPTQPAEVQMPEWQQIGANNLVIGRVNGSIMSFDLFDIASGTQLLSEQVPIQPSNPRRAAHIVADKIYEKLTGIKGVAATRIAYVAASGRIGDQTVTLNVSDADGFNPQTIVSSKQPILSPSWSPDGGKIAYVSFENNQSAIYIQNLSTGKRERVASYPGHNGAPAFSPDGQRLAMVLSKDGNPEIYVLDLITRSLQRITNHFAIDTEPSWSPDGRNLIFTSDRGGSPQIYQVSASGGTPTRISAERRYNATPSYSPDGQSVLMLTRTDQGFGVALQNLQLGTTKLLSSGPSDEHPKFAPNGRMVIFTSGNSSNSRLIAVPTNGAVRQVFSPNMGAVREAAWSPFFN